MQIIAPLLREGRVDFEGRYYQARDCEIAPRGPRPAGPPILIGAQRPRMMRLAARFADIYDTDFHLEADAVAERLQAFESACAKISRDSATLSRAAATTVALSADGGAAGYARFEQDGMVREAHQGDVEELIDFARTEASQDHRARQETMDSFRADIDACGVEMRRRSGPVRRIEHSASLSLSHEHSAQELFGSRLTGRFWE